MTSSEKGHALAAVVIVLVLAVVGGSAVLLNSADDTPPEDSVTPTTLVESTPTTGVDSPQPTMATEEGLFVAPFNRHPIPMSSETEVNAKGTLEWSVVEGGSTSLPSGKIRAVRDGGFTSDGGDGGFWTSPDGLTWTFTDSALLGGGRFWSTDDLTALSGPSSSDDPWYVWVLNDAGWTPLPVPTTEGETWWTNVRFVHGDLLLTNRPTEGENMVAYVLGEGAEEWEQVNDDLPFQTVHPILATPNGGYFAFEGENFPYDSPTSLTDSVIWTSRDLVAWDRHPIPLFITADVHQFWFDNVGDELVGYVYGVNETWWTYKSNDGVKWSDEPVRAPGDSFVETDLGIYAQAYSSRFMPDCVFWLSGDGETWSFHDGPWRRNCTIDFMGATGNVLWAITDMALLDPELGSDLRRLYIGRFEP